MEERVVNIPTTGQLEKELYRENYKSKYKKLLKSTISVLIIVVATAILIATLIFPVLRIYGGSMEPTLISGDVVL